MNEEKDVSKVKGDSFKECCIENPISEEHLDKEILKKFTTIRKAFENQPVRRLSNMNY